MSALDERIARIKRLDFAFNDACYDLVKETVFAPHIGEMDRRFGTQHSVEEHGGAGVTGSDTSALLITVPREKKKGLWNSVTRACSPRRAVIRISLAGNAWRALSPEYQEYAQSMAHEFETTIMPHLFS